MNFIGRHAIALALGPVVSLAFVVTFWPLLESPGTYRFFGYGDSWRLYGPSQFFLDHAIHSGEFPLWNPLVLTGQPIAGNPECLLFYPPNLIRSALTFDPTPFRTHVGMAILQWLHVLLAAYGTYAAGRALSQSPIAAAVAGFAYAFSAAYSGRVFGHHYIVYAVAWWPVALCCLQRGMQADSWRAAIRWGLLLGAAFGMSLLAGSPQLAYLTGFGLTLNWLVVRADLGIDVARKVESRERITRSLQRDIAVGGVAVAVAVLLATALIAPALEFSRHTPRGGGAGYEPGLGDEGWNLFELFSVFSGSATYEGIKTLSATGLLLALTAFFTRQWRAPLRLLVLALLLVDASRDGSLLMLDLVVGLAPLPITAAPRGMLIACVPIALLAGYGVDVIRTGLAGRNARALCGILVTLFALAISIALYRKLPTVQFSVSYIALIFSLVVAAAIVSRLIGVRFAWVLPVIVLGVFSEPVYWGHRFVSNLTRDPAMFFGLGDDVARGHPEFWRGNSRAMSQQPNTTVYALEPEINGYQALYIEGILELLDPGSRQHQFRRGVDPFTAGQHSDRAFLLLKRSFWLHREFVAGEIPDASRAFPPATTAYLRAPQRLSVPEVRPESVRRAPFSPDARALVVTDRAVEFTPTRRPTPDSPLMWKSRTAIPPEHKTLDIRYRCDARVRVSVVAQASAGETEPQMVAGVTLERTLGVSSRTLLPMPDLSEFVVGLVVDFPDGSGTMTLERVELIVDEADEVSKIRVVERSPNAVEVELLEVPGPRILSHIDFRYAGWHAYLDGAEVPIMTAFSHFKAIEVPAGTHRVRFEFRARLVYASIAVSLFSLIAWAALLYWTLRKPKPANTA